MRRGASVGLVVAACVAVAACATQSQVVADREDLLAAAGFTIRPANTPDRIASLQRLPPERFVQQVRGGRITFVYADPLVCACLYIGDQGAYDRYKHEVFARNLANEQQMTAQLNEDSAWDFGPWGPGWYYTY